MALLPCLPLVISSVCLSFVCWIRASMDGLDVISLFHLVCVA